MNVCLVVFLVVAWVTVVYGGASLCPGKYKLKHRGCGNCKSGRDEICLRAKHICCKKEKSICPKGYKPVSRNLCSQNPCKYIRQSGACCQPGACQNVAPVGNGQIIYTSGNTAPHPSGTIAMVVCNSRYTLSGSNIITCKAERWSIAPTCIPNACQNADRVIDGQIIYVNQSTASHPSGTTATVVCDSGYTVSGSDTITCNAEMWSRIPFCNPSACQNATPVDNGRITYTHQSTAPHRSGTTAKVVCNSRYTLSGYGTIYCNRAQWSIAPTCTPNACQNAALVANGQIIYTNGNTTPHPSGTTATVVCDSRYILSGSDTMTCDAEKWSIAPTCTPNAFADFLLFVDDSWILYRIDLPAQSKVSIANDIFARGIDFDPVERRIYWADYRLVNDIVLQSIRSINIDGTGERLVRQFDGFKPFALAVDPDARLLFYMDIRRPIVNVSNIEGTFERTIIHHTGGIRRIALDLINAKLYWIAMTTIGRANYDGSNKETIINTGLEFIQALVIDSAGGKMFWSDLKRSSGQPDRCVIESANLDGSSRYTIIHSLPNTRYVTGLTLFGTTLYYTRRRGLVGSVDVTGATATGPEIPSYNNVITYAYQPGCTKGGRHPCSRNNGGCSHFCLPMGGQAFKCDCPTGFTIGVEKKNCKKT